MVAATQPSLPDALRLGPVHLTVTDLDRSTTFYERAIGLQLHERQDGPPSMGAGREDLLVLHEDRNARPAGRHAGLYHFALLHPSREELARAARRLSTTGTPISGASDHGISEAIYLPDPDGNGIELAADRSREHWGDLSDPTVIGPQPLDVQSLMRTAPDGEPPALAHPGLVVGHVHLHVGDVEEALRFYRDVVGFETMTEFPSAAFVSAGGYHHHLAVNTWRGEGVPEPPADAVGLRRWTIVLPQTADLDQLTERLGAAGVDYATEPEGIVARGPSGETLLFGAAS